MLRARGATTATQGRVARFSGAALMIECMRWAQKRHDHFASCSATEAVRGAEVDALTGMLWALHGLVTLSRTGRLRAGYDSDRLQLIVEQFTSSRQTMR